ncbi:MAG: type IV pilus biogenesis protein PilM [Vicinamibacterales bacterium]
MSLATLFRSSAPDVAIMIDRGHVGAARVAWRASEAVVVAHASQPLASGAVVPALASLNMPDVPLVGKAIASVLDQLGTRPSRVALVVPDIVAKVSLLKLDKVPSKAADLHEVVRWQMRKSAPFPIEQAVVSVTPGAAQAEGGQELVVSVARTDVIQQYEQACALAGAHAGLVDLATFSVINGVLGGRSAPSADWLLVHITDSYISLAVLRGQSLIFFRNRSDDAEGTVADLIHQTAMYYEDRLSGSGFEQVLFAGGARLPGGADEIRRGFEDRLGIRVKSVDPRVATPVADRVDASPEVLDLLAPLVGLLVRERRAA